MLRALVAEGSRLLSLEPDGLAAVQAALTAGDWRAEAATLLGSAWREQVTAAAAVALGGADEPLLEALWHAIDSASWVVPQLVAAAFLADPQFEPRAAARLTDVARRPPKTIGSLVRAYHRLPAPRLPVVAELHRHERTMATEEACIGVRGVDLWLDRLAPTPAPTPAPG
jgi:hypothetical protein